MKKVKTRWVPPDNEDLLVDKILPSVTFSDNQTIEQFGGVDYKHKGVYLFSVQTVYNRGGSPRYGIPISFFKSQDGRTFVLFDIGNNMNFEFFNNEKSKFKMPHRWVAYEVDLTKSLVANELNPALVAEDSDLAFNNLKRDYLAFPGWPRHR